MLFYIVRDKSQPAQEGRPINMEGRHETKHRCQGQTEKIGLVEALIMSNDDKDDTGAST